MSSDTAASEQHKIAGSGKVDHGRRFAISSLSARSQVTVSILIYSLFARGRRSLVDHEGTVAGTARISESSLNARQ
jgi:hypothetical protein